MEMGASVTAAPTWVRALGQLHRSMAWAAAKLCSVNGAMVHKETKQALSSSDNKLPQVFVCSAADSPSDQQHVRR